MAVSWMKRLLLKAALAGAALLAVVGSTAHGQYPYPNTYPVASGTWGYANPYAYANPGYYPSAGGFMASPSYGMMYPGSAGMYGPPMQPYRAMPAMPFQPYFCPPHPCMPGLAPPAPGQATPSDRSTTPSETPGQQQPGETPGQQQPTDTTSTGADQGSSLPGEQASAGGTGTASFGAPEFGNLIVPGSSFVVGITPAVTNQLLSQGGTGGTSTGTHLIGGGGGMAGATVPFHSAFEISENEIPRPMDRAYVTYNYYSNVAASGLAFGSPGAQVHREMVGGEKTFLSGNASIGVRLPIFETFGSDSIANGQLGDTSIIFKYALWLDRQSADVLSTGLVVTLPTGLALQVPGQSSVNATYFQPWVGGIKHFGNFYFVDFTSVAAPTDARDITFFFTDLAFAYMVYRNTAQGALLRGILPDLELHVNIPFDHTNLSSVPIGYPPTVDFTGGCYFFLGRALLGMAAGTPLTGPKPYGVEAFASLNFFF
jgi:hypothetical protein